MNSDEGPGGGGAAILVVDDMPANRELLAGILDGAGYGGYQADCGERALEAAKNTPPDLVLLDILMPGMDGYAVCRHFKADLRLANIPIMFVTALDDSIDKVRAFAAGGVDYVTRPFDPDEIVARVKAHLRIRAYQVELENAKKALGLRAGEDTGDISLTTRERECLSLLARGMRNDRIAEELDVSMVTVEFHLANARRKLNSATREQALAIAVQMGLVTP